MAIKPSDRLRRIAAEIREELRKLDSLYAEWRGVDPGTGTLSLILRGKASIFHDFYCGAERIFKSVADEINGGIPAGESWHRLLLNDMKLDMPGLRPPAISEDTYKLLSDFLNFRHKFRNIYGFDLEFEKVAEIEKKFSEAHEKFRADIEAFLVFVENLAQTRQTQGE